uniref:AP-4 complex subunit epsilon-1 C-terminal domain-containing protein n=1 Tax=Cyprinodon variegatus TaxID=28743 RepID=A0A3Q2DTB1_CYPVA
MDTHPRWGFIFFTLLISKILLFFSSTALKLDGVKRLWGRDGYLVQKEPAENPPQTEVASPVRTVDQQANTSSSNGQTPTPSPECDPEKQQLASSLFVGLASQSSVCLMGKPEPTSQRFRRKPKESGSTERITNPAVPPSNGADNLLCKNLLDSSDLDISSPEETHRLPEDLPAQNGSCYAEDESAETDPPLIIDEPPPNGHSDGSKDSSLASHLPAELSAFPRSEIVPLHSNRSLAVSACHVQKEEAVLLVVFVSNCSDFILQQMRLQVTSEELEVRYRRENIQMAVYQYLLTVKRPSVHFDLSATFQMRLHWARLFKVIHCVSCRALRLSTEEYGAMWLAYSQDTKQNLRLINDGQDPLDATLNVLKRKLHLHVVEVIGAEGIVACCLRQDQPCLMHCRVHAGMLAVWLRSPVPELPDCLLYHCQRALQEL